MVIEVKLQIDGYLDRPLAGIRIIASNPAVSAFDLIEARKFLFRVREEYPDISFTLDDASGNQVVRGDDVALTNVWERSYFQLALKGNKEVISEGLLSKNTNEFMINLGTPVYDAKTGAIVGVMQGSISLAKISEFVTKLSTNGAIVYVIDTNGSILAHPDLNLVKAHFDMSDVSFVREGLGEKKNGFSIVADKMMGKKLVTYVYDKRTGWLICLEMPYSVISAKTHTLSILLGLATMGILTIDGVLILYIAKRRKTAEMMLALASIDQLTNIANRRHFIEITAHELKLCRLGDSVFCILLIDADHFKSINDTYGHDIGDLVLKKIVEICRANLRDVDFIGRWGGDEFVVLLPGTVLKQGTIVAERICRAVEQSSIQTANGPAHTAVSIGVSQYLCGDIELEDVLKKADIALYEAKRKGKNRVCIMEE